MRVVGEKKDLSYTLARHIVSVNYNDLSGEAVRATKNSILDTLGVMVAATGTTEGVKLLADLVKEAGGKEESSLIGFRGKVPVWMAAFVNGAMGHCLDYDDVHEQAATHPSTPTVPAAFAISERLGNVDGKKFITAMAVGIDLACRMPLAVKWRQDWILAPVCGVFGATALCCKILGLNEEQIRDAFGIAILQSAGTMELCYTGGSLRGMRDGFPAKGGVLSALMAGRGIKGAMDTFEGRAGFFNLYFRGEYNRDTLTAELGKRFEGVNVSFKAWPCCRETHPFVDGTLEIVTKHDIRPEEIEEITAFVGSLAQANCEPLEIRRKPATTLEATWSIPFSVSVAAVKRKVVINDFTPESIKDQEILKMARKVNYKPYDVYQKVPYITPGKVEIKTKKGQVYYKEVDFPRGHPQNPLSQEELKDKFRDCMSYSTRRIPKRNTEKVIEMVDNLEEVSDVGQIVRLLS